MKITIKNYRCFPEESPVEIDLKEGFTSFLGVNNSGKSSILKFFYEFRYLFLHISSPGNLQNSLLNQFQINYPNTIFDFEELFSNRNNKNIEIEMVYDIVDKRISLTPLTISYTITVIRGSNKATCKLNIAGANAGYHNFIFTPFFGVNLYSGIDLKYLVDTLTSLANTLYIGPFRNIINIGTKEDYYDIEVGQSFISKWRQLKEGNSKKTKQDTIKLEEEIKRIFGFDNLQINPSVDDKTLSITIDKQSYMLPELGSGLSQFILVFANASIKNPDFILIDEPELNLHPTLQLDFLTSLAAYSKKGILFATHIIGLAEVSSDTIYSVKKISHGISSVNKLNKKIKLPEFLGELSYSGYKELGSDTVLLVEGTSDLRVIQQFLKLLNKEHEIIMIPLGGRSMINAETKEELAEIQKISPNIHVIIDSEKLSATDSISPQRKKFIDNCKQLGINYLVLEYRALENYLTDSAIKKIKGEKYRSLTPYEKSGDIAPCWSKKENWLIAKEMELKDIENTDLGKFLINLIYR